MTELKPCPFCGGEGSVFENPWSRGEWEAQCKSCEAGPSFKNSEAEAIAAWNTRALDPQVAKLEAALEAIEMRIRELQGDRRNFDHLSAVEERELSVLRSIRAALATTQKG